MPNIKSAKKRVKVISAKTLQNQIIKSGLKTCIKNFEATVLSGDKAAAEAAFRFAVKKLDQAAAKNLLHDNAASRKKSQMALKLNSMN
ncbi:MAG: 30S ribosomal protein S20 [Clostridia bacterium]|nr:30S ribosomal protein S20 [Clostridia bacterium]